MRACLKASPTAYSFRKVSTSVGEQEKEQLGNLRQLQVQSPFPVPRWRGWVLFACLLWNRSDHFPL